MCFPSLPLFRCDMMEDILKMEQALKEQPAIAVTFYTKAGCHLCEDARDLLEEIAEETEYTLIEIDIRSDPAVFTQYRYRIPVIVLNEKTLLEGRIEAEALAQAFQQQKGR